MSTDLALPASDLPPAFRPIAAPAAAGAFRHALAVALDAGAGTFVRTSPPGLLDIAVVLEPEEALAGARRVLPLALDALAAAAISAAPPGTAVDAVWPDALLVHGALCGGVRLAALPADCAADDVPDALVLGLTLRLAGPPDTEPGAWRRGTALAEEGFEDVDADHLAGLLAAHLLSRIDLWQAEGFAPVGRALCARLAGLPGPGIAPTADLVDAAGAVLAPAPAVGATPSWLDPATEAPWL